MIMQKIECKCLTCGAAFNIEDVPEGWKKIVAIKCRYEYCDPCRKQKIENALSRLPQVIKAISDSTSSDPNDEGSVATEDAQSSQS